MRPNMARSLDGERRYPLPGLRIALIANEASGGGLDPEPLADTMRRHGAEVRACGCDPDDLEGVAAWAPERVAVVSGPNLAHEIAVRQPAASVVACTDHETAERLAHACSRGTRALIPHVTS